MLQSLFWKEWRLNRGAIYGTLLLFLGWIGVTWLGIWLQYGSYRYGYPGPNDWWVAEGSIRVFGYYILCSILACGIVATSFADEKGKKTMAFLFIQPLSRTRIWLTKTIFGLIFIGLVYIAIMVIHRLTGSSLAFTQDLYSIQSGTGTPTQFTPYLPYSLYLILMMYALTMLFSVFLDNTAVTILAGCTGTFTLFLGLGFVGGVYCWQFNWQDAMRLFLPASVICFVASHLIFCRADYWDKPARYLWLYCVIPISIILFLISLIPYRIGVVSFHQRDIHNIFLIGVDVDEQQILFSVQEEAGESRIWTTAPKLCITGRGCDNPILSPVKLIPLGVDKSSKSLNQSQIAFVSDRSYFGWRRADRQTRIWLMNPDGSHKRALPTKDMGFGHDIVQGNPALIWSPDGTKLAYRKTVFRNNKKTKSEDQLCIFNLKTSIEKVILLPEKDNNGWYLKSWFADNHSLYIGYPPQTNEGISLGACYHIRIDGTVIDKHYHTGSNQSPCSSPDGKWQAFSDVTRKYPDWHIPIMLKNLETGNLISVIASNRFGKLFWSPDSRHLAFVNTDEYYAMHTSIYNSHTNPRNYAYTISSAQHSLWILPLQENAGLKQVADIVSLNPVWSPDGRYIVFIGKQKVAELPEEAATTIYDMQSEKSWFISSPGFKDRISVPTSRYKGSQQMILIDPTLYTDLIWVNDVTMAYTVALKEADATQPKMVVYSIHIDGKERKQLFP
ncbi:MAG: ABC transporter permease subunit [bacterium]